LSPQTAGNNENYAVEIFFYVYPQILSIMNEHERELTKNKTFSTVKPEYLTGR
jgi:hypothetical protein